MKNYVLSLFFTVAACACFAQLPSDSLYYQSILELNAGTPPENYGTVPEQALPVGSFKYMTDAAKLVTQGNRFYKTFTWPDGTPVSYASRYSKRYGETIMDVYTLVKPGTGDTIRLYVNMYKEEPLFVPAGLKAFTKEQFAQELAPYREKLKEYFDLKDNFIDPTSKETSIAILTYVQKNIGMSFFMDKAFTGALAADKGADATLKSHLFRSYIFHKLYFSAMNTPAPSMEAYRAMLADFRSVTKLLPDLRTGMLGSMK